MRSLLRTTTGYATGAKASWGRSEPCLIIRHVRDRKSWRRELIGFVSDVVVNAYAASVWVKEAVREMGRWFIMEGSKL